MLDELLHVGACIAEVLAGVEVRRVLRKVLSDGCREGDAEVGIDVDLADGEFCCLSQFRFGDADGVGHGTAEFVDDGDLVLRDGGSAVQHDGEAGKAAADLFEDVDAQLGILTGLELISAVRGADGDGERVDARACGEFFHFVGRSEHSVMCGNVDVIFDARELAELRFDDHAVIVRVFDHLLGDGDVLFPRLGGSVDHDGGEAAVDGGLADLEVCAVVEVHGDGDVRRLHRGFDEMAKVHGVGVLSRACRDLQDDGRIELVRSFDDGLDHLHIVHVERADRIAAGIRLFEHFRGCY